MPFRFRKGLRIIPGLCLSISVERRLAPSAGGANRVRHIKKRERRHLESHQRGRRADIVKWRPSKDQDPLRMIVSGTLAQ